MQNDVAAATHFVEGEVRRLLSGSCEAWELVMTVGPLALLYRIHLIVVLQDLQMSKSALVLGLAAQSERIFVAGQSQLAHSHLKADLHV